MELNRIRQRYEALKSARSSWDAAWESLSELFLPFRWRPDGDDRNRDSRLNTRLVNSCGVLALRTLAAGMQGGMTSPARPWFKLALKSNADEPGVNAWLEEVTERMSRLLHESSFYNTAHGLYADLAVFGTALMVETADENGIKFHLARPGEYVLDVNGDNEVDTFFRRITMSARQIVDSFGEEKCPSVIVSTANQPGAAAERFNVIHGVFPRRDAKGGIGPKSLPYTSLYWLEEGGDLLDEGGYYSFPAFAPRWSVNGSEVYGRSPAMDVTADCRMLQAMTRTMRTMQHKLADPPMVADSSLQTFGVDITPGAINYADAASVLKNGAVQPIAMPNPQSLNFTMQAIADVEKIVRDGLYSDLFRMLMDDDRRQITATEIQARTQEKMVLIGPVVERLHREFLEPLITRTFELMRQHRALPPVPEGMDGGELEVTFESVLAQAQKLSATSAIDQGWAFALQTAQATPDALDIVNTDAMVRGYLKRAGMPESCINDEAAIEKIRQERAKAQEMAQREAQMQAMTENARGLTEAAKNMGQTPVGADGQTLMQSLLSGLGGM